MELHGYPFRLSCVRLFVPKCGLELRKKRKTIAMPISGLKRRVQFTTAVVPPIRGFQPREGDPGCSGIKESR